MNLIKFKKNKQQNIDIIDNKEIDLDNALKIININDKKFNSLESLLKNDRKYTWSISAFFSLNLSYLVAVGLSHFNLIPINLDILSENDFGVFETIMFVFLVCFAISATFHLPVYLFNTKKKKIKSILDLLNRNNRLTDFRNYRMRKCYNEDFIALAKATNNDFFKSELMHIYDLIVANKDDKESIKKIKDYLKLCQNKQMDFNIVFLKLFAITSCYLLFMLKRKKKHH